MISSVALETSRFSVPNGWKVRKAQDFVTLVPPEQDFTITFLERPLTASIHEVAQAAWQHVHGSFTLIPFEEGSFPSSGGWDAQYEIGYDVPTKESRGVRASINVFQHRAYVALIDGSLAGLNRRGAQANQAVQSWRTTAMPEEKLLEAALPFGSTEAQTFARSIEHAMSGYAAARAYSTAETLQDAFRQAMSEVVFDPLGMAHTTLTPPAGPRAAPHARDLSGRMISFPQRWDTSPPDSAAPAGAVWSTIDDLSKYLLVELSRGMNESGVRVISEPNLMKRRTPGVAVSQNKSYGLGLFIEEDRG